MYFCFSVFLFLFPFLLRGISYLNGVAPVQGIYRNALSTCPYVCINNWLPENAQLTQLRSYIPPLSDFYDILNSLGVFNA